MQKMTLLVCLFSVLSGMAQDTWTLERCIQQAWEKNLTVQQSALALESAESQLKSTKGNMLPNLNGFATHNYNWGQRIDPFTNQFASSRVQSNSFGLSSDIVIFNGFQNQQARLAQEAAMRSSAFDVETQKNAIALSVSSVYLSVLMTNELIEVAERQLLISRAQLERITKMVEAGSSNLAAQYELEAQLARDRAGLVQRKNDHAIMLLQLKQLMLLPADETVLLEKPANLETDANIQLENANTIYGMAESSMPEVKSAEYSLASQERIVRQAKSGWYPSLSLSGSIGSGYSGLRTQPTSVTSSGSQEIGFTTSGESVFVPTFQTNLEQVPFVDQVSDNFNQFIGFSLSVPIFNRFNVSNGVEQARINRTIAELQVEQVKLDLRQQIEQARLDAETAKETFVANRSSLSSSEKAFQFSEARFEAGALNTMEFNNSKTNLQIAQSQLLQSKYDYIFKLKVLDFYMGKPLRL